MTKRHLNNVEQMANLENVENIAIGFVKKSKCVDNVNVTVVEEKDGMWVVRGTCPIDLGGHPWRESFVIRIDRRGKIQSSSFKLM